MTGTSTGEHPNVEVFRQVNAAFTAGDMGRLADLIAADVVWHVPGTNLISGEYTSREAIFGCFGKIFELSESTYAAKLIDILANDQHTVAIMHGTARHAGKALDQDYAFILRISDGQVVEVWEAWTDGAAWNDFWS